MASAHEAESLDNNDRIIKISRGNMSPYKIAILPANSFDENLSSKISQVIKNDLERSGFFESMKKITFPEQLKDSDGVPNFALWKQINAAFVLKFDLLPEKEGKIKLVFRVWDVFRNDQVAGSVMTIAKDKWRRVAHITADRAYSKILGEKPYFNSKITFVEEEGSYQKKIKKLMIMDQDGANVQQITDGSFLVLTPRFSPNTHKIIYLSYEGKTPQVYLLDLLTGENRLVGKFPGMSYAPKFSPDGKTAVMSVAKDGASNIYLLNLKNFKTKKITNNRFINTSPSFSPDGKKIVYTSDKGGLNQLYVMDRNGKNSKRISFGKGSYSSPSWSPRGDYIAFSKVRKGKFKIGLMRPNGKGERILTTDYLVESPSWSPNGRVIIYSRTMPNGKKKYGKSSLHTIDVTGYHDQVLTTPKDATDPSWSPIIQ